MRARYVPHARHREDCVAEECSAEPLPGHCELRSSLDTCAIGYGEVKRALYIILCNAFTFHNYNMYHTLLVSTTSLL